MATVAVFPEIEESLEARSARLEAASPQQILRWAMETYGDKLTMSTAFGTAGCCLIDMIARLRDETGLTQPDIFNLETGYQFPETLELRERLQEKYDLEIRLVSAVETIEEMEARLGGPIYGTQPNRCCHLRKVVPLEKTIEKFDAWISGIRRDQTPERATTPIVGRDARFDLVKISPLANWSKARIDEYVRKNDVPINPLYEQGFLSIGCWPCTRAVGQNEDERAGRWAGQEKRECGLHWATNGATAKV